MYINLTRLHAEAAADEQAEHMEGQSAKLGNLRAGNSGTVVATGEVAGSCHRVAHLRMLGIDLESPNDSTLLMFEGGFQNEASWLKKLTRSWPGSILTEEQIPVSWTTSEGKVVSGRPDIVLMEKKPILATQEDVDKQNYGGYQHVEVGAPISWEDTPVLGIELKGIGSMWTLRDVWSKEGAGPKLAHLCQAGHYSWQLGEKFLGGTPLAYKIVYTSYVNFVVPDWASSLFPKPGEEGSEHIEYNEKTGKVKHLKPQMVIYDLAWTESGQLMFSRETADTTSPGLAGKDARTWHLTPVTREGIRMFYEKAGSKQLGGRPLTLNGLGSKQKYSNCDYCPLQSVCDSHDTAAELNYPVWLRDVRRHLLAGRK